MAKLSAHGKELARIEQVYPAYDDIVDCHKAIDRQNTCTCGHKNMDHTGPSNKCILCANDGQCEAFKTEYVYHGPHLVKTRRLFALFADGHILRKLVYVHCEASHRQGSYESRQNDTGWKLYKRFKADCRDTSAMIASFNRMYSKFTIAVCQDPGYINPNAEHKYTEDTKTNLCGICAKDSVDSRHKL